MSPSESDSDNLSKKRKHSERSSSEDESSEVVSDSSADLSVSSISEKSGSGSRSKSSHKSSDSEEKSESSSERSSSSSDESESSDSNSAASSKKSSSRNSSESEKACSSEKPGSESSHSNTSNSEASSVKPVKRKPKLRGRKKRPAVKRKKYSEEIYGEDDSNESSVDIKEEDKVLRRYIRKDRLDEYGAEELRSVMKKRGLKLARPTKENMIEEITQYIERRYIDNNSAKQSLIHTKQMALLSTKSQWSLVNSQSPKKTLIGQKKKHEITPPDPKYFQCLQIQPGSAFFRALLECKYPIGTLSLNIPAMLVNLGFSVLLRTSITSISRTTIDKQGKLKITENVKMEKFVRRLEKRTDKLYADQPLIYIQEINDKHPWQEIEVIAGRFMPAQTPITRREMCERYARGPSYNQIFKQYVRSAGERMQMYRLFYYASRKAPIAVTFVKKVKFEDPRYVPEEKFLVSDTQLELVDTFAQSGKSIERMQLEAKKLCSFLSRAYGFRVEEFVADFVKDKSDIYWLVNVKSFILENSNYHVKKLEHEKLIENQAVLLELLREQANDSSIIFIYERQQRANYVGSGLIEQQKVAVSLLIHCWSYGSTYVGEGQT
eukprot:TRINITY_DN105159_c0_g1_i1.p2 TRINITY_DN105159_c0_g1~~TRINITY_DN105159_c0_g1_i1.p2  ORF type:complete len:607 (-),score=46.39 TRINITY_DN105159_c0_g1_i1:7835-9655(-)